MHKITRKVAGPPVRTAKVKLLKGVTMGPNQDGVAGEIYELPKHKATELVSHRLAVYTDEGDPLEHDETPKEEKEALPTTVIEAPTARDPKPARRGGPAKKE